MTATATPNPVQHRIGVLLFFMAGAVALTPLVIALMVRDTVTGTRPLALTVAAFVWLVALVAYRAIAVAHERRRRRTMREEMAAARKARLDSATSFEDKLNEQYAILDRIAEISEQLVEEGIIDPQLAIDNIRLVSAHAREAQAQVEDTVVEVRVDYGSASVDVETFDVRDEIEEVASSFVRGGLSISTTGPRLFAETDPAMFRLMVRGLVTSAAERQAETIDVSVARNDEMIVCTVSDDGFDTSHSGLSWVSPVTKSIAHTAAAELDFSRALGRNQYSVAVPAGEIPEYAQRPTMPLDVGGKSARPAPQSRLSTSVAIEPECNGDEIVTFLHDQERDLAHSIAARRVRDLAAR